MSLNYKKYRKQAEARAAANFVWPEEKEAALRNSIANHSKLRDQWDRQIRSKCEKTQGISQRCTCYAGENRDLLLSLQAATSEVNNLSIERNNAYRALIEYYFREICRGAEARAAYEKLN